ncbi:unnamed protein product [Cuscuta epithymum]|uniref:Uncharacterized protein n=1 Tax=Cuscuta epithymum TaxID=186058 RepID=A0AAV0EBE4_9ASTE|nr:unnamed protein product [Cuscuta epithymum]
MEMQRSKQTMHSRSPDILLHVEMQTDRFPQTWPFEMMRFTFGLLDFKSLLQKFPGEASQKVKNYSSFL